MQLCYCSFINGSHLLFYNSTNMICYFRWMSRPWLAGNCAQFPIPVWSLQWYHCRPVAWIFWRGLHRCLMCMYVYISKQAHKTRGSGGMFPQELDLLGPWLDKSRAIVATVLSNFRLSYMHLLSQLTLNFHKRRYWGWKNSRWGDIYRRTTAELSSAWHSDLFMHNYVYVQP